jgi:type II secretory pathway pseudopilin PulG
MISMSIFAVMSVIIMSVYIQTTNTARKLNATRELSETAREITERIAQDVRDKGIADGWTRGFDTNYQLWKTYDYTWSGSEFLAIAGKWIYVYGKRTDEGMKACIDSAWENTKTDPKIHCGLYVVMPWDNGEDWYNLVDSFVPEESKKRVKITDLRFYISGWESTTKKVTLVMTLALMPRIGVPASMIENTKLQIQTTISEQGWKR